MSSTHAAGFGVREAFKSFSIRRSLLAAVSFSSACRIFCEKVHSSQAGSFAISITAFPKRRHSELGEEGHVIGGEVEVDHDASPVSLRVRASRLNASAPAR